MKRWLFLIAVLLTAGLAGAAYLWLEVRGRPDDFARLADALEIAPGAHVAELGAGAGRWTVEAAGRVGPRGRVYATDIDAKRLAQIRDAVRDADRTNVVVVEGAAAVTRLPDACCDAVFMRTVYHHFTDPHAMVRDIRRSLRPGGRLGIVDFEPAGFWPFRCGVATATPEGVPANRGGHGVPMQVVAAELRAAGFEIAAAERRWSRGLFLVVARRGASEPPTPRRSP